MDNSEYCLSKNIKEILHPMVREILSQKPKEPVNYFIIFIYYYRFYS